MSYPTVSILLYPSHVTTFPKHVGPDVIFVCGHRVQRNGVVVKLPTLERRVFLVLATRRHTITSLQDLVEAMWGDDADGGPLGAENRIVRAISVVRDAGAALGFTIKTNHGRGYTLMPLSLKEKELAHVA